MHKIFKTTWALSALLVAAAIVIAFVGEPADQMSSQYISESIDIQPTIKG